MTSNTIYLLMNSFRSVQNIVEDSRDGSVSKTLVVNSLVVIVDLVLSLWPGLPIAKEYIDAVAVFFTAAINLYLYVHTRSRMETKLTETGCTNATQQ